MACRPSGEQAVKNHNQRAVLNACGAPALGELAMSNKKEKRGSEIVNVNMAWPQQEWRRRILRWASMAARIERRAMA